jgi:hypothetical protein
MPYGAHAACVLFAVQCPRHGVRVIACRVRARVRTRVRACCTSASVCMRHVYVSVHATCARVCACACARLHACAYACALGGRQGSVVAWSSARTPTSRKSPHARAFSSVSMCAATCDNATSEPTHENDANVLSSAVAQAAGAARAVGRWAHSAYVGKLSRVLRREWVGDSWVPKGTNGGLGPAGLCLCGTCQTSRRCRRSCRSASAACPRRTA